MGREELCEVARVIFERALESCGIERAFAEKVKTVPGSGGTSTLVFGDHSVDFSAIKHARIVAVGKAATPMLHALLARLPKDIECSIQGVLIAADAVAPPNGFQSFAGGHPLPNEASFAGARAVLEMLRSLPADATAENTLCLFLISGGASAMMELPLDPAITLAETIAFHQALVHSGASIMEINCIRKHFSAVKGGRCALAAWPAHCLTILLSDVPVGNLDSIGSAPTLPDSTTIDECRQILARYHLLDHFPRSIRSFFESAAMPETVKPEDLTAHTWTILSANDLAEAASARAKELGFEPVVDNTCDDWDYRDAAQYLLGRFRELRQNSPRACLISAGEIIVRPEDASSDRLTISSGNGGRNQHFALYIATLLKQTDAPIAVLSAGSDGIDGNSDAAGAVVDTTTLLGADNGSGHEAAELALREFHSSTFLASVGTTIVTGPTGNNLRDLRILLADSAPSITVDHAGNVTGRNNKKQA